jgi:hypothetical protein
MVQVPHVLNDHKGWALVGFAVRKIILTDAAIAMLCRGYAIPQEHLLFAQDLNSFGLIHFMLLATRGRSDRARPGEISLHDARRAA